MSEPVVHDIVIQQGSTFRLPLSLEDEFEQAIDLTGASARMQGRVRTGAAATLFSLTSGGGDIVIDEDAGSVVVTIDAATTAALSFTYGVYDLEVEEADGTVLPVLRGTVKLQREVTR